TGPAAVVDIDLLSEFYAELLRDQAPDHIVTATRRERNDQPHGTVRIVVGRRIWRQGEQQRRSHQNSRQQCQHESSRSADFFFSASRVDKPSSSARRRACAT